MKTTRIVLSLMVLSILWCADVFAHMLPDNQHFCPGEASDPCEGRKCGVGHNYDGGHGHIDKFYLKGDSTKAQATGPYDRELHNITSWGYWSPGWV